MKAREFDELIKRKIDQGEFEYEPARWDELADRMDGKPGKRKSIMWLSLTAVATLSSIAASLAMVISFAAFLHQRPKSIARNIQTPHAIKVAPVNMQPQTPDAITVAPVMPVKQITTATPQKMIASNILPQAVNTEKPNAVINAEPVIAGTFNEETELNARLAKKHKNTYKYYSLNSYVPEEKEKISRTTMLSVAGGFNFGSSASGYSIGASGRKMIGDKLYVEGDLAFVNSNATQTNQFTTTTPFASSAKSTYGGINETHSAITTETVQNNYNMYYAQLTPSIGYNVFRRISVGAGADMQRLLDAQNSTNGPATDGLEKTVPGFDFGAVGKLECALSDKLKAGFYYRQGLNNTITGSDKYIDRNYMQIQLKYTLINK